ncbi:MAG: alpha-L-arabinofuranosidase C-terminal domain-containing protein [Thermoguttaceae bacterium]
MSISVATRVRFAALCILLGAFQSQAAETTKLTVHVDRPGHAISPMLYGIFFEEINRAGDGGLYAEMVQNGSFEDDRGGNEAKPVKMPGWTLLKTTAAQAQATIDASSPVRAKNPNSLRLDVQTADGRIGVANDGFRGMALKQGAEYRFSLYARAASGSQGALHVTLEDTAGKVYASAQIDGLTAEWKKFDATLTANATTTAGRLVIAVTSPGTIWTDQVSLFPKDTWKGRPNGLRSDLAEMIHAMKPSFVRFPGGCYLEGDRLGNAFRWKNTLGDLVDRPGHWNLWGYRSTDGLGYHEYLQFCEDLGAEPLFVANCGMSHEEQSSKNDRKAASPDEYLQDALDAIEYANGPVDSKWGSLRAKAGHPAPFHLKYLEIGNENSGPLYDTRYALFYRTIHARYPKMNLIANCETQSGPLKINDEHYYNSAKFFMSRARLYDGYRRDAHKVYVGEYAVTDQCGNGNLRAAIGEAAFMTGMERNSDVVVMASYAPLLVNVGWRQWNPDAIQFDNARLCGTPSYYVQRMFSEARGHVVLSLDLDANTAPGRPDAKPSQDKTKDLGAETLFAVASRSASGDVILKVVNADGRPRESQIDLAGLDGRITSITATVLTSAADEDENTLDQPTKVIPVTRRLPVTAATFHHQFPARSATVMRATVAK